MVSQSSLLELLNIHHSFSGMSLAFAIAERLLDSHAMTLFVTHFPLLTSLPELYSNAKNLHLKISSNINNLLEGDTKKMEFLHEVAEGPFDLQSGYGLLMAEMCAFPQDLIKLTSIHRNYLNDKYELHTHHKSYGNNAIQFLLQQLVVLLKHSSLDNAGLKRYLHVLRSKLSTSQCSSLRSYLQRCV
jgi:DNA mismatch repair ATPase MutS